MNISRRFFIGGASAFGALGAFGGARFAPTSAKGTGDEPRLRLGVVSDIHVTCIGRDQPVRANGNCHTFRHTLEWFRDQKVDGVAIAGDMADNGVISQLEAVGATWDEVFPNGRAPDGRPVERLFVCGNHDMGGIPYARYWLKRKSKAEIAKQIIFSDPKTVWERVFHEPYAPMWHKMVKGYSFVGAQWLVQGCKGHDEAFNGQIADFYAGLKSKLDPRLPFFHIQHPHPKGTCHGPSIWGQDTGLSTRTLSLFPNAISLTGHSHTSLTDPRFIWQEAFTSIGTSSLRYCTLINTPFRPINPTKAFDSRTGLLLSVYDDRIVVRRREFLSDLDLGDDLVLPLPAAESRPFAFAEHARRLVAPEFAADASVAVAVKEKASAAPKGGGKPAVQRIYRVTVPAPKVDGRASLCHLEFAIAGVTDAKKVKCALGPQTFYPRGHRKAAQKTTCTFTLNEVPSASPFRFVVTPVGAFGRRGKPLYSEMCKA